MGVDCAAMTASCPKMFRTMQPDGQVPKVGRSRRCLGVVPGLPPAGDIEPDAAGGVHPATGGMSVAPAWADLPVWRVPKRLASKIRGAAGSNGDRIWRLGSDLFTDAPVSLGLRLRVDKPTHGNVEPDAACALTYFETALQATQASWVPDEP